MGKRAFSKISIQLRKNCKKSLNNPKSMYEYIQKHTNYGVEYRLINNTKKIS